MHLLAVFPLLAAAVTLTVACQHAYFFYKRPDRRVHLTFALTCLAFVLYDLFSSGLYNSQSLEWGMFWQRLQIASLGLAAFCFTWFVSDYTGIVSRKILFAFSPYFLAFALAGFLTPDILTWPATRPSIKEISLPWGGGAFYYEVEPGWIVLAQSVVMLAMLAYVFWASYCFFKKESLGRSLPLVFAVGLFFAGLINDSLVSTGFYLFIYTVEYAYLGIVILMAYSLSSMAARAPGYKESLRESRERLASIVSSVPDTLIMLDPDLSIVWTNKVVENLLGPDLEGQKCHQALHGKETPCDGCLVLKTFALGKNLESEISMDCTDGAQRTFWVSTSVVSRDTEGRPAMVLESGRDITERKEMERRLRDREEELQTLLTETASVIITLDGDFRFVEANPAACEFFEIGMEKLLGRPVADFLRPGALEKILRENPPFEQKYKNMEIEHVINGMEKTLLVNSVPMLREGKRLEYCIAQDITKRKRMEKALVESEERFRGLVENAPDIIYSLDEKGCFTSLNQHVSLLLGFRKNELIEKPFSHILHPEDQGAFEAHFQECVLENKQRAPKYRLRSLAKDGTMVWLSLNSVMSFDEQGAFVGEQGVARDITRQVRLESRLQQAQKMEAIGSLAGGIAHDFNNLLMGIQGHASLMALEAGEGSREKGHLKGIEEIVSSASELTRQLLGLARGGKYEVWPMDINELGRKVIGMFGRAKKEITIHEKYQTPIRAVEADQGQLEQVLLNLLVNAWQAMPGGGHIYLETRGLNLDKAEADSLGLLPGEHVTLSVADTGMGMDRKTRRRVFDPFFTTKEGGRGAGLGLASAYGIVESHGGVITVRSEKDRGSDFTIYLPASEKSVEISRPREPGIQRGQGKILLIDDEAVVLDIGQDMIRALGYAVQTASGGKEAVACFSEAPEAFALVILDMVMPEMGGKETFEELRKIRPDVPVLLASGYSMDGHAESIMNQGCNGFIQKPFDLKQLSLKIKEILNKTAKEGA